MSKLLVVAMISLGLLAAGLPGAQAAERTSTTTGANGRTATSSGSASCADKSCSGSRSATGPNGKTATSSGSASCSGGSCSGSRSATGARGNTATKTGTATVN